MPNWRPGKQSNLNRNRKAEAPICFVALENNAYSKSRYICLLCRTCISSENQRHEKRLNDDSKLALPSRVTQNKFSHAYSTYLAARGFSFGLIGMVQLLLTSVEGNYHEFVLCKSYLKLFLRLRTTFMRWSFIGLCSSEKQRLQYANPPHLTWVAVLLSSFVTSITGSDSSKGHVPRSL